MDKKRMKGIIAAATAYISLVILSNLGSLRVISISMLTMDGGSLLYPFTFTVRDMLHKKAGAEISRFTIWLSSAINLLLFAFIWLVAILPADPTVGPQQEYAFVLVPGVRLVLALVIAMTISELLDTRIYTMVKQHWGNRKQWLRVILSNAVSVPLDTAVFIAIAFIGRYTLSVLGAMFLANMLIKYLVSLVSLGGIFLIKEDRE